MVQNITSFEARYNQKHTEVTLGTGQQTQQPITVSLEDLHSGTTITGVQGSGKTAIAINLGLQEIKAGASLICLDPSTGADMIRDIISRMPADKLEKTYYLTIKEESKLYSKHPFSLNIFSYANPGSVGIEARAAAKNQIILAFDKLFPATDGVYFQAILRNLIPLLLDHPTFTLFDIEDFLLDDAFRSRILEQIENPRVTRYWYRFAAGSNTEKNKLIGPFLRRLGQLLDDPFIPYHIGQKRGALDIRQAILNGEILLIHLPLDDMAYRTAAPVMGTLLMMQIYAATFSFGNLDRDKRPNFCLLVDEFTKWVYDSGDEFKDLFSLGRKYGISQVLLMQYTSQLDEQNLKSLKDGITSAKTFISLRSTLQDGPHLAPRFTGLKRRPTDIYREVLPHLEDAKNPALLKEFYWDTVRPLQLAAKLDKDRKTGELPSFNFGFGVTTFEPSLVTAMLEHLNTIFYYAQKEGRVQEQAMQGVLEQYGRLVGLIQTEFVDDSSIISQIRNYERYIPPLEQEEKEKLAAYVKISDADKQEYITAYDKLNLPTDTDIRLVYTKIIEDAERESIIAEKKIEELEELSEVRSFFSNTSEGRDPRKVVTYIDLDGMQRTQRIYEAIEEIKKRYEVLGSSCTVYPKVQRLKREREELERSLADYKYPWHVKWENLERKHEEERQNIRTKYAEAISAYTRKIAELKRQIKKEIQVELPAMKPVRVQFQQVLMLLIAEPLAVDKSELSASDIASLLPHVADRHGYIKTPSGVYAMKTIDLSQPVPLDETSTRWNTILSQTKKKYCPKGRAEINQEIEAAFKKRLLPQDKPVNNETASGSFAELTGEDSEKRSAQQGQEPIDPKKDSGKQKVKKKREDVFDMLDANESTE